MRAFCIRCFSVLVGSLLAFLYPVVRHFCGWTLFLRATSDLSCRSVGFNCSMLFSVVTALLIISHLFVSKPPLTMIPNHRAALDAGCAVCLHFWRPRSGASERGR
jgi:hypothetical protein